LLDRLTFSLISTEESSVLRFIDTLVEGMKVKAWFGYIDGSKILNQDQEMFVGYIAKLEPDYPESGHPRLSVTMYDPAWLMTRNKPPKAITWPRSGDKNLTMKDMIKKLVKPYRDDFVVARIDLPQEFETEVLDGKQVSIVQQAGESDWKLLKRLAHGDNKEKENSFKGYDCLVYMDLMSHSPVLYFVPEADRMKDVSDIEFVYPMYGSDIVVIQDPTVATGEMTIASARIEDNPDFAEPAMIEVPASAFEDKAVNEILGAMAVPSVTITQEEFYDSFEIDNDAIAKDEKAGTIKWGTISFLAGDVGWEQVKKYVKFKIIQKPTSDTKPKSDVKVTPEQLKKAADTIEAIKNRIKHSQKKRNSAGITMHVQIPEGNPYIRPRKVYKIHNLGGKYSSSEKVKWFADTVTHVIDGTKYTQTIKFTQ